MTSRSLLGHLMNCLGRAVHLTLPRPQKVGAAPGDVYACDDALHAVPGRNSTRSNEAFSHASQAVGQGHPSRPGTGSRRTSSSSAYPGYLRGVSHNEASSSSRPRTGEDRVADVIQLPEVPFVSQLVPNETIAAGWEHAGSSLTGQWHAHVRYMSDVE
jgi:hypothetical protein